MGPDWDPVEVAVSETEIDVCFRGGETGRVACTGSIERPKAEDARDLAAASGRVCAADLGGIVCPDHDHGLLLDRRERATHVAVGTGFECALTTRGNVSCFGSLSRGYREGDAGRSDAGTRAYATERVREIVHDPSPS